MTVEQVVELAWTAEVGAWLVVAEVGAWLVLAEVEV